MIHPDVEQALIEVFAQIVPDGHVTPRLEAGFESGPMPVVLVNAEIPGPDVLSTVQAEIQVFHRRRRDVRDLTAVLLSHAADRYHQTESGFLDYVRVRQQPKDLPYQFAGVERMQFVLDIDTRPV